MRGGESLFRILAYAAAGLLIVFLSLPFAALILGVSPARLAEGLGQPAIREALALSFVTSLSATALVVVLGTPLAWLLATHRFPGRNALETLVQLPMVLPPTVAGFALLVAFGRAGLAGHALQAFGVALPFTTVGVVVAQAFMAAPFYIMPARAGFQSIDPRLLEVAATLRAGPATRFFRVMLPIAGPALLAGAAMACARALGEFGATITFAGNLPGVTQTMPLAVYVALESDLDAALALSIVLLALSIVLLFGLRFATRRAPHALD
jgi:molybdate transport system permease protein